MSEVRLWAAYFEAKTNLHDKSDWYMAQIVLAIYETMGGVKNKRVNDYLLKFEAPRKTMSEEASIEWTKMWVNNLAGLSKRKATKKKKPALVKPAKGKK